MTLFLVVACGALLGFGDAHAQRNLPPEKGGTTCPLGMPPVYKGRALFGFVDFLQLPELCEWVETQVELDALLPSSSGMVRAMAGLMKLTLWGGVTTGC